MVIVEEGPWNKPVETELRRLQERLYGCIDAALDGQLARDFPATSRENIVIQLDCYNLPEIEIRRFFEHFTSGVFSVPDYRNAIRTSPYVNAITFDITFDNIH